MKPPLKMFTKISCPTLPGFVEAPMTATEDGEKMASNESYGTWIRKGISVFFEYDTPRIVHIKSKRVKLTFLVSLLFNFSERYF